MALAFGDGAAWVLGERLGDNGPDGPYVWRIDPKSLAISDATRVNTLGASDIAVGGGWVWVASPWDGLVIRVSPGPQPAQPSAQFPGVSALAYDNGTHTLWAASPVDGIVRQIDTQQVTAGPAIPVSGAPQAIAVTRGAVFASVIGSSSQLVSRTAPSAQDVQGCGPVISEPGRTPDLLVVGSFPLTNPEAPYAVTDSDAIVSILREHGFRAGNHTIGYQACDDTGTASGTTVQTCRSRAEDYARVPRVVAVVTGYLSDCAKAQVPVLARAGPLAAIGSVNTDVALTDGPYQNYVRVTPNDRDHVTIDLKILRAKAHRVFLLQQANNGDYPGKIGTLFHELLSGSGLVSLGDDVYDDDPATQQRIATRVARLRPDAVYIAGFADSASAAMVSALRRAVPGLVVVAGDAFIPVSTLIQGAPKAVAGLLMTSSNPPNGSLPSGGREWLGRFAATQRGGQVPTSSVLAAASAEVLLDAIRRSDGTRKSVTDQLGTTQLSDSVIGPVSFMPEGDIASCRISEYRVVGGTAFLPDVQSDLQGTEFVTDYPCERPGAG